MHACYLIVSSKNKTRWLPNVSQASIKFLRNFIAVYKLSLINSKESLLNAVPQNISKAHGKCFRKMNCF